MLTWPCTVESQAPLYWVLAAAAKGPGSERQLSSAGCRNPWAGCREAAQEFRQKPSKWESGSQDQIGIERKSIPYDEGNRSSAVEPGPQINYEWPSPRSRPHNSMGPEEAVTPFFQDCSDVLKMRAQRGAICRPSDAPGAPKVMEPVAPCPRGPPRSSRRRR